MYIHSYEKKFSRLAYQRKIGTLKRKIKGKIGGKQENKGKEKQAKI